MQVEEEREKGSCPFPCSLTSLLSMNCRARVQVLSQQFQTQSKCKRHHGVESAMLVESDGKVRLASSDNRTYSLDDYNLETFYRNSELKNLRPIHVVTSEPTLHLCLPSQPVVREEPSPTEQEQDSDVYFDFDLITPPDDYACAGESGNKTQESIAEESEKQERPESGCVTSVTSPIMFSVDFDLPPSNAPSPMDDCALEELNSRPSDIDLETVRQLLVSSQNKTLNEQSSHDRQFEVTGSNIPDFIGIVKGPRYPKTTSYSENSTSSTSECDSSSETGFNIPEEEKELISKEKNMSRNMSYYLPPPSSYQIFRNKERDMDNSESSPAPKSKQRATKTKHKKKKLKSHSPNKNESSGSRDLTPEFGIRLSSSPESSSIQSITLRENNKPRRHLIIRSNSADHVTKLGLGKKIKASHSFEKCACDSVSYSDKAVQNIFQKFTLEGHKSNDDNFKSDTCSKEETLSQSFPESRNKSNNKHSKNTNPDYDENIFKELSADDIKIKLEIEGGQAVSTLNEEDILKEINEAIAILKNQYDNSLGEKLAKYESSDVDALGSKTDKKANCLEQVAVLSHTSPISATNECQKYESVSQLCEVCEEVPHFAPICVKDEKCDISIRHKILRFSSYDNSYSTNDLIASAESKMPKSKGRSKVKRASSETLSPQSHHEVTQLSEGARFPNDISLNSSSFNKDKNMECSNFYEKCDYPNPNKEVQLNNNNYDTCCALQYNSEINDCSVFHVESNFTSDVLSESLQEKNCFVLVKENKNENYKSSSINGENGTEENNDDAPITGFVDSQDYENVSKNSCETINSSSVVCENLFGCESQVISNLHSSTPLHILNKSHSNGLNETCSNTNTYYLSSDFLNTSKNETNLSNNLQKEVENSSIQSCNTESRDPVTFNVQSLKCLALQSREVDGKIHPQNFVRNSENESADTKSTTTYKAEFKNFQPVSESDSDVMHEVSVSKSTIGDSSESVNLSENKNESEIFYNEEVLDDEIELLPSDYSETKTSDGKEVEEEESDEEILVSSRFRKVSTYTERIKRLSEDDDEDIPLPPTEIILIDYNEPSENPEEEISEEKNISADLTSELNKLSLTEPTIEGPSDESERSSEERETDVDLQQRIKRSSSLRCGKTPPGTPGRKKIVRFADALGLDLADIRTFLDGVPTVPPSAFCDLQVESEGGNVSSEYFQQNIPSYGSYTAAASAAAAVLQTQAQRILTPMFQQPGALPDFYNRLREQKVVLENVSIGNDLSVKGVVRVVNEDYHKRVYIRYTFDHWRNFHEATATYLDGSCDGFSDRFSFLLWGSFLQSNGSLVFCVKYCVKNKEYWDSNRGSNYVLHCYSAPPQPHTLQGKPQNNGSIQQQEEQNSRHRLSHHSGLSGKDVSHYSSFMDSPNTPTDPWATKFF